MTWAVIGIAGLAVYLALKLYIQRGKLADSELECARLEREVETLEQAVSSLRDESRRLELIIDDLKERLTRVKEHFRKHAPGAAGRILADFFGGVRTDGDQN